MIHLIPKKSKVNMTVWKDFTIADVGLLLLFSIIAVLILMSNLPGKWFIEFAYVTVTITLFRGDGDIRIYQIVVHIFRHWLGAKKYVKTSLQKKHTRKKSVDLLMPQTGITEDGTIEYDGLYYAGVISVGSIEFRLLDEYSGDDKIIRFAKIINALTPEQQVQIVKIDRPVNFDDVAEKVFDKINDVDKTDIAKQILLKSRLEQIDCLNNVEKQYRPFYYLVFFDETLQGLEHTIDFVKTSLQDMDLSSNKLNRKDVAVFLKYCYTRNFDEREIDKIEPKDYLDWVKPNSVEIRAFDAKVDDIYTVTYALSDYPLTVENAWGSRLFNIDNTKVVLNIKPIDKEKSVKRIDRAITEVVTKENLYKASELLQQDTHVETMGVLLGNLQNENENLFDCTLTITGFNYGGEDKSAFRKKLRSNIMGNGFRASYLAFRQIDGLVSSSITRRNPLRRYERGINSVSLAAVFPFVFTSIIDGDGLPLGYNNYPVLLDIWKRDYTHTNSNMFVVGKTGGGKSYFTKTLLSLLYSDNCKIHVLDPENEYNVMANNFGGKIVDVGSATKGRLNPFHIYEMLTDDGNPAPSEVVFTNHLRFLESFFKVVVKDLKPDSLEILNNFVLETYKGKGITQETNCSKLKPEQFPTFDDLMKVIDRARAVKETNPANGIHRHNLELVKTHMEKFAGSGRNAKLWNGPSTLTTDDRFEVFNFQSLLEGKNTTISNAQMLLVMRYLEQQIIKIREQNRGLDEKDWLHPVIVLDEGYNFIDPNYPVALDFVFMWYKRIRKYGGLICFITQNLGDIFGNAEIINKTTAITNNSQYSFIFPLAQADLTLLTELYKNAGEINDAEKAEIANGGRGHCFLISAPRERTSFQVVASDTVCELFTTPHTPEEIAALND